MSEGSSAVACLIVTTSGRILLLWDQDDTLPFRYPQLAMLLASLFHFAQAQPFGHLELQNGFTVLISSDVEAQVSVAVICATPAAIQGRDFSAEEVSLQLGRLKSLIILQEFVRCFRGDIDRLAAESVEHAKLKAEEYTLTSALDGFQDECDGTLDEFVAFHTGFVSLVIETTARGIQNSIMSWSHDGAAMMAESASVIRLARGFLMNAETGDEVFSTYPSPDGSFFDHDSESRRLHYLHNSARVQHLIKHVAKALHESTSALIQLSRANSNDTEAAVVVKFKHLSGRDWSELFVALRTLPTGVFASGVVFYGVNTLFRGRESASGKLQQALAVHPDGKHILSMLDDPSVDMELHVGSDGAPEGLWKAMDLLMKPLPLVWSASPIIATKSINTKVHCSNNPIDAEGHLKENATPRLPQLTE